MKKHHWAILLATLYLVVYTLLVETSANMLLLATLFAGSSVLLVWLVVTILKAPYHGRTLQTEEEYGYADKPKEMLP
jgi:hypothetical protein